LYSISVFLQRVHIVRNADRCSQTNFVRPSVHASRSGVLSRRMNIRSCGLQRQVGQSFYTVSQKVAPFKRSVTLSNLNRFSNFCTAGKRTICATKHIRYYLPHFRHVATLPLEIKNSNFLQM